MSYTYISKLVNGVLPGKFKTLAASTAVSASRAQITKALNAYGNNLKPEISMYDEILYSLTQMCSDQYTDNDTMIPNSDADDDFNHCIPVNTNDALAFISSIKEMSNNGRVALPCGGAPVNLIVSLSQTNPEILTQDDAQSFREKFLFLHEGQYYVNTRIKTIGYYRAGDHFHLPDTILSRIGFIQDIEDWEGNTFRDFIMSCNASTLLDAFNSFLLTPEQDVESASAAACAIVFASVALKDYGIRISLGQLVRTNAIASTLKQATLAIIESLLHGVKTVADLYASLSKWMVNAAQAIKDFINGAIGAFQDGGWYGLAMYVIDCIKGQNSVKASDDGKLVFTDNARLSPQQYIGTIVCQVVGGVVSMVGMMLSAISPVFGAIGALVGSIVGMIPLAFNYDYQNNTTASMNDAESLLLDYAPIALMQGSYTANTSRDWQIIDMCKSSSVIAYTEVPGGVIILGLGDRDDELRYEFHPLLGYIDDSNFSWTVRMIPHTGNWKEDCKVTIPAAYGPYDLAAEWFKGVESYHGFKNSGGSNNNCLNSFDDTTLRNVIIRNYAIFLLTSWLYYHESIDEITITNPFSDWNGGPNPSGPWLEFSLQPKALFQMLSIRHTENDHSKTAWTEVVKLGTDYAHTIQAGFAVDGAENMPNMNESISRILRDYSNDIQSANQFEWGCELPKYDRRTFLTWIIASTLVVAAVTVLTITASLKIKKWRYRKRMQKTAQVSNAYENYTNSMGEYDPNDPKDREEYHTAEYRAQAYKDYYKAVKSNNRWAILTGGTTYSLAGYWDTDEITSEPSDDFNFDSLGLTSETSSGEILSPTSNKIEDQVTLNYLAQLISGKPLPSS